TYEKQSHHQNDGEIAHRVFLRHQAGQPEISSSREAARPQSSGTGQVPSQASNRGRIVSTMSMMASTGTAATLPSARYFISFASGRKAVRSRDSSSKLPSTARCTSAGLGSPLVSADISMVSPDSSV